MSSTAIARRKKKGTSQKSVSYSKAFESPVPKEAVDARDIEGNQRLLSESPHSRNMWAEMSRRSAKLRVLHFPGIKTDW